MCVASNDVFVSLINTKQKNRKCSIPLLRTFLCFLSVSYIHSHSFASVMKRHGKLPTLTSAQVAECRLLKVVSSLHAAEGPMSLCHREASPINNSQKSLLPLRVGQNLIKLAYRNYLIGLDLCKLCSRSKSHMFKNL